MRPTFLSLSLLLQQNNEERLATVLNQLSPADSDRLSPFLVEVAQDANTRHATYAVGLLLKYRPEWVDAQSTKTGDTALMVAVRNGLFQMTETLLQKKANRQLVNHRGDTVFNLLMGLQEHPKAQEAFVSMFLETTDQIGPPCTRQEKDGALIHAVDHMNLGGARALIKAGAGFSLVACTRVSPDTEMGSALVMACAGHHEEEEPVLDMMKVLLSSPKAKRVLNQGWETEFGTPTCSAAFMGNTQTLALLLDHGAQINPVPVRPEVTPLMHAALGLQEESIALLLERGADPRKVDREGRNALHHLALNETELDLEFAKPCVRRLMAAGVDPLAQDAQGHTPTYLARKAGDSQLADWLQQEATPKPDRRRRRTP